MKTIRQTMYIIVDKRGNGDSMTLRQTRRECIYDFMESFGTLESWKEIRSYGWSCKKVFTTITDSFI